MGSCYTAFKEKGFFSRFPTVHLMHFWESQNRPAHYRNHFTNHCCLHCAALSPTATKEIERPALIIVLILITIVYRFVFTIVDAHFSTCVHGNLFCLSLSRAYDKCHT